MKLTLFTACLVVAGLVSMGATANADELAIDTNLFTAQAYNAAGGASGGGSATAFTGSTFSGSVELTPDADDLLNGIDLDGVTQSISGWSISSFQLLINLSGGNIATGSMYSLSLTDGSRTDTFTANLYDDNGASSNVQTGVNVSISAGLRDGTFSSGDSTFAGVDVASFLTQNGSLFGSVIQLKYNPDGSGYDEDSDVDATVVVPVPTAALGGLTLLLGLGFGRFRRRRA
jgi:hypothetical protein